MKKIITMMLCISMTFAFQAMDRSPRERFSPASIPSSPSLRTNHSEKKYLTFLINYTVKEEWISSKQEFLEVPKQQQITILCTRYMKPSDIRRAMGYKIAGEINDYIRESLEACEERERSFPKLSHEDKKDSFQKSQQRRKDSKKTLADRNAMQEACYNMPDETLKQLLADGFSEKK